MTPSCPSPAAPSSSPADARLPQPPQRNLNNAFAYDLVPSPGVVSAALRAARRVNDFPTAVRIFEGRSQFLPHNPPMRGVYILNPKNQQ